MSSSRVAFLAASSTYSIYYVHAELKKPGAIQEDLVTDLKLLMHRNTDEIEKLRKMMKDFDAQLVEMMQQIKDLADSKSLLQQT